MRNVSVSGVLAETRTNYLQNVKSQVLQIEPTFLVQPEIKHIQ